MRVSTFFKAVGLGVVALGVAGVAILATVDVNQYRGLVEKQVEAATGRALTINGTMDLAISLTPAVVIEDVAFANASWGSRPEMVTARRVEAQVQLLPLLQGRIQVDRLVVVQPDVLLEIDETGTPNWAFGAAADAAAGQERATLPDLRLVRVEDATVVFADHAAGTTRRLSLAAFEAAADGWSAPLALAGSGKVQDAAFTLEGSIGPLSSLTSEGGVPYPVDLTLGVAGATLAVEGTLAQPMAAAGIDLTVRLEAPEPHKLVALATGTAGDDLPPLRLDGRLSDVPGGWRVENLAGSFGETSVAGTLTAILDGLHPKLSGSLSSPRLDLAALLPARPEPPASATLRLFPTDRLPLWALGLADADLELAVQSLMLPDGIEIAPVTANVSLAGRRLSLKPLTVGLGGGTVSVVGMFDASRGDVAALALDVDARGVVLGPLLAQMGKPGLVSEGPMEAVMKVSGLGASVHGLMDSLDGSVTATVGTATVDNQSFGVLTRDLAVGLLDGLNPFADTERYTAVSCGVVKLSIEDGIATADRGIAVQTEDFSVVGSGSIDLGAETVDLALKTSVREGAGIATANLANLVRIQGPILDPGIGIDPLGAARTAVSIGGAVATGGLSLLAESLIERTVGTDDACAVALGRAPQKPAPAAAPAADPVQGLGNTLKGLFGQ